MLHYSLCAASYVNVNAWLNMLNLLQYKLGKMWHHFLLIELRSLHAPMYHNNTVSTLSHFSDVHHSHMWPDLPKSATYAHNGKERFSSPIDSSVNKLIVTTPLPQVDWSAFFEACFWGLSDIHEYLGIHWMPLVGLYRQPPCWKPSPDLFMM